MISPLLFFDATDTQIRFPKYISRPNYNTISDGPCFFLVLIAPLPTPISQRLPYFYQARRAIFDSISLTASFPTRIHKKSPSEEFVAAFFGFILLELSSEDMACLPYSYTFYSGGTKL